MLDDAVRVPKKYNLAIVMSVVDGLGGRSTDIRVDMCHWRLVNQNLT
jgi:hypothetical protein